MVGWMDVLAVLRRLKLGTRACDAIEILPLASALPSNRWLPNRGPCQAGVHALPSSSLSPRLIDSRGP